LGVPIAMPSLWRKLFGTKATTTQNAARCSNCAALVIEIEDGTCAFCAYSPEAASRRRTFAPLQYNSRCSRCGISEEERFREGQKARAMGMLILGKRKPVFLYCEHCVEHFCGNCQIDLGLTSGCPVCKRDLEY